MTNNPVNVLFTDDTGHEIIVSPSNPLPVTLDGGGSDQDVNIVSVGGAAVAGVNFSSATVSPTMNGIPTASVMFVWDPISSTLQKVVTPYGDDAASSDGILSSGNMIYDGTNWDRLRSIVNATNSTGTGIAAVGLVAQVDNTSPTAVSENQFGNVRMSADRSLLITTQNTYAHISTAATTTVKSGVGTLKSITVNTLGTVASTATIYDSTTGSGTVIGVINTLALGGTFSFDVQFTTGLTIVTTGTVAPDLTVSYK